jgi:hypothetical protein
MPVERKARTDWMQGGSNSNQRKCSKKGSANHDVWKLMNAGEIQMEGWLKLVRKERNYQRYRCLQLNEELNLIEREKRAKQAAWIPGQRWRDLMEWLGDFNRKLDGSKF